MPQQDTVGQRINYIRTQMGLTLEALADRSGMSKSFLWEVEQDRSGISGSRLLQVGRCPQCVSGVSAQGRVSTQGISSRLRLRSPGVSANSPRKKD